jgi:hypothetical protein
MSDEIKPLTKKILESGIIDESMAAIMERWGALPEGAAALAANKDIEHATKAQLIKLADEVGDEVEKALRLRESMLDLDKLKWPVTVTVRAPEGLVIPEAVTALIDRVGRYYFRAQDIGAQFLVPGYVIVNFPSLSEETILEVTELYVGEDVAAIQVSTTKS